MQYTLRAIQSHIGGEVSGDGDVPITGVNALELARPGDLTFAEHAKYAPKVRTSRASAFIVPAAFPSVADRTILRVENPRQAFLRALYLFHQPVAAEDGVHRSAVVSPEAELGPNVTIRECAVVRPGARIGARTLVDSGVHIGEGVVIGADCLIGPNVTIMRGCRLGNRVILHGGVVIGADGFGYVWADGRQQKIPQLGDVILEDDVELGANVCVDRATFGSTIVGRGTKIDNLVQIGHNDVIGQHVIMSGQVGLAGSVTVGDRVLFGGQAGIADHLTIGDDARIAAGSGVIRDVRPGETVWWYPARPIEKVKEELAALALLPKQMKARRAQSRSRARPRRGATKS